MDLRETPQRVELPVARVQGGAAPQDRRCRRILESGRQCRDWSVRGWDLCSRHGRYRGTSVERPIEVPLLEDDAAVTLVLSQAVRALAWGTIPPANGRAVIAGCKAATEVLKLRVTVAKLEAQLGERAEPLVTDVVEDRGDLYSRQMSQEEVTRAWLEEREARSELAGQRVSESDPTSGHRGQGTGHSERDIRTADPLPGAYCAEPPVDAGQVVEESGEDPQGLKPGDCCGVNGTTESRALIQNQVRDCASGSLVESHVCEHRADMGHPEVVGDEVVERPSEEVMVETMVASVEATPGSGHRDQVAGCRDHGAGHAVTALWRAIEGDLVGEPEVEADAAWEPVVHVEHPPRFRDLKDRWERAARRFGESLADLKVPRKDEDREMWKAALRRPWDGQYPGRG